jgi:hypothetical protein
MIMGRSLEKTRASNVQAFGKIPGVEIGPFYELR